MNEFQVIFIIFIHFRVSGNLLYLILYHYVHLQHKTPTDAAASTQPPTHSVSTKGPTDVMSTQGSTDVLRTESPTSTTGIGKVDITFTLFSVHCIEKKMTM
jgi:hypothetical protein